VVAEFHRADEDRRDLLQIGSSRRPRHDPYVPQSGLAEGVEFGQPAFGALDPDLVVAAQDPQFVPELPDLGVEQMLGARLGGDQPAERAAHQGHQHRLEQARPFLPAAERWGLPAGTARPHHPPGLIHPGLADLPAAGPVGEQQAAVGGSRVGEEFEGCAVAA
jgi:hypothetical protein